MTTATIRKAIYQLHEHGLTVRDLRELSYGEFLTPGVRRVWVINRYLEGSTEEFEKISLSWPEVIEWLATRELDWDFFLYAKGELGS